MDHSSYKVTFDDPVVHDNGVTKRGITVDLHDDPSFFKYRILLMEEELFASDAGAQASSPARLGYFDFIEL